jgi:hypothetical protein
MSTSDKKLERRLSIAALAVSVVAVVLSQFRPLHELLEKPDLRLELSPNIELGAILGHVELTRYATITNRGQKAGTVLRSEMFVSRLNGGFDKIYPVSTVSLQRPQFFASVAAVPAPWHPLTVLPDGDWSSYVSYSQPWSTEETSAGRTILNKAASELPPAPTQTNLISDATFSELSHFIEGNMAGFGTGSYGVLTFLWEGPSAKPSITKCELMDVLDLHMKTFTDNLQRARNGVGLIFPNGGPIPTAVVNTKDCDARTAQTLGERFGTHIR